MNQAAAFYTTGKDTLSANVVNLFPKHYQNSDDQQNEKIKNTMRKQVSIAFQRCILRGGQHLVEVSQNKAFLQKRLPEKKTAF